MEDSVRQSIPARPVDALLRPFQRFTQSESAGGIVLLAATLVALGLANSPWTEAYHDFWESPLRLGAGIWEFEMSLHHFTNDALMAVFFFVVGLEIKREMIVGELASPRAAALPIAAALGGMVVPAALYALVNAGGEGSAGWGIPMATDIAFALGILALAGKGVPVGLKVFLAALAIVDDLGAVVVIALFYTSDLDLGALAIAVVALLASVALNRLGVRQAGMYAAVGLILWLAVLASGVHATIAGVLLALTIPARTRINTQEFLVDCKRVLENFDAAGVEGQTVLTNEAQQCAIQELEENCEAAQAPLMRLEHGLHPWVAFAIIPIFALANAGVSLSGDIIESFSHPVAIGVILGLVLGKPIGISLASWAAVRFGGATLPQGVSWRGIAGASVLGGIGFTMSIFIANLGFGEGSELLALAKLGILTASAVAAVTGWLLLRQPDRSKGASSREIRRSAT
jgi:Na+:H+ antiporter, NhaA family